MYDLYWTHKQYARHPRGQGERGSVQEGTHYKGAVRACMTHTVYSYGMSVIQGVMESLGVQEAPTTREQYEHARAAAIPWMVIIEAATFSATDTVLVRSHLGVPCMQASAPKRRCNATPGSRSQYPEVHV